MGYSFQRRGASRSRAATLAILVTVGLLAGAPAALADTDTWTGQGPATGIGDWSDLTNWGGMGPQTGDTLALNFGPLSSCPSDLTSCYSTIDDIGSLTASNLLIADNLPYVLKGSDDELILDPLTGDGLDATPAPAQTDAVGSPVITVPLVLGNSQTWSVMGNGAGAQLSVWGAVSGARNTLGVTLSLGGQLYLDGAVDTGGITVTGGALGPSSAPNVLGLFGSVDARQSDGPIDVDDVALQLGGIPGDPAETGPLSVHSSAVTLGANLDGGPGRTSVDGDFTMDQQSSMTVPLEGPGENAGTDYGQLNATGDVSLGVGGDLTLIDNGSACQTATVGSVDTFITTTGTLSGQFANLPDGATTTLTAYCGDGVIDSYPIQINYTSHTMTGTFVGPGTETTGSGGIGATGPGATSGSGAPSGTGAGGSSGAGTTRPTGSASGRSGKAPGTGVVRIATPATTGGGGTVDVTVRCAKGGASCVVMLRLLMTETTRHDGRLAHHTIVLGSKRVAIGAGDDRVSAIKLSAAGERMLVRQRVLRARLVVAHWVSGHLRTMSSRRVTLRAPHR